MFIFADALKIIAEQANKQVNTQALKPGTDCVTDYGTSLHERPSNNHIGLDFNRIF
jgi:hypothetical protein